MEDAAREERFRVTEEELALVVNRQLLALPSLQLRRRGLGDCRRAAPPLSAARRPGAGKRLRSSSPKRFNGSNVPMRDTFGPFLCVV